MKKTKLLIVVIIAIVIAILAVKVGHKRDEISNAIPEVKQRCYIWNTEAGDSASLRMTITKGESATGSFDWRPAKKDSKRGVFEGTVGTVNPATMSRTAELWWHTSAEGTTTTEQLFVQFDDDSAMAGFGEMKDRGDGIYVYAHPFSISYMPVLARTDCSDEALQ